MIGKSFTKTVEFNRMIEMEEEGGGNLSKESKREHPESAFSDIVKKAYDRGMSEQGVTVKKLVEELKSDLIKIRLNND
jgi:hypothetical protein